LPNALLDFALHAEPEIDDEMADSNKFDRINQRLDSIEARIGSLEKQAPGKPSGISKAFQWGVHHKGQSAIYALVLCLLSIFGGSPFSHWLDHREDSLNESIDRRLERPDGVNASLKRIEQKEDVTNATLVALQPFIQDLVRHQMDSVSKLSPEVLERNLPAVTNVLQVARSENVQIHPDLSDSLRKNFLQVPQDAAGYWPAAAELVSYRSTEAPIASSSDKTCNNEKIVIADTVGKEGVSGYIEASNCTLDLDVEDVWQLNAKKGSYWDLRLHNVRLHYSGIVPLVGIRAIILDHCTLDFHFTRDGSSPPPNGRAITLQLLASSDPAKVEVNLPGV
jgi:hypothetical protein